MDDSKATREVLKVFLLGNRMEFLEAVDGERALEAVREHLPDAVVTDLTMPRLDGVKLCEAILADPKTSRIPVVVLTSHGDLETRVRCKAAGARVVLEKPVTPKRLHEVLVGLLAGGRDGGQA